jgi:hypothetical protein
MINVNLVYGILLYPRLLTMAPLASKSYVFDPRPNFPLLMSAKRYWDPSSPHLDDPMAVTLVFGHGTGFSKEIYEPTLEELYTLLDSRDNNASSADRSPWPRVREAWSIDCPNHGDAALLNESTLRWGYEPICELHC